MTRAAGASAARAVGALLLAIVACKPQRSVMKEQTREPSLLVRTSAFTPVAAERVNQLQFVGSGAEARLVVSDATVPGATTLRTYVLDSASTAGPGGASTAGPASPDAPSPTPASGAPSLAPASELVLPAQLSPPQWSAHLEPDGSLAVALSRPGSAMSPLVFLRASTGTTSPLTPEGMRVFASPRFVKRASSPVPVVAIESRDHDDAVVLLSPTAGYGSWSERVLPTPNASTVQAAVLGAIRDGYLLLYKTSAGVRARPDLRTRRRPPNTEVSLGTVQALRLDASLAPVGEASPWFDATPMYEFDADVEGDRVVLLGTTPTGYVLTEGRLSGGGLAPVARVERHVAEALCAPAVQIGRAPVHFAVLENGNTPATAVLYGHL